MHLISPDFYVYPHQTHTSSRAPNNHYEDKRKGIIRSYFDHSKSGTRGFSGDCYQIIQAVAGKTGKRISSDINSDHKDR